MGHGGRRGAAGRSAVGRAGCCWLQVQQNRRTPGACVRKTSHVYTPRIRRVGLCFILPSPVVRSGEVEYDEFIQIMTMTLHNMAERAAEDSSQGSPVGGS